MCRFVGDRLRSRALTYAWHLRLLAGQDELVTEGPKVNLEIGKSCDDLHFTRLGSAIRSWDRQSLSQLGGDLTDVGWGSENEIVKP